LFADFHILSGQSINNAISSSQKHDEFLIYFHHFSLANLDNQSSLNGLGVGIAHADHKILNFIDFCVML
jgi:hypothetical protein